MKKCFSCLLIIAILIANLTISALAISEEGILAPCVLSGSADLDIELPFNGFSGEVPKFYYNFDNGKSRWDTYSLLDDCQKQMYDTIEVVEEHMPVHKTRYLMGVGTPTNIIEAVARGVDFFDCVMPARNARHARLFTWEGAINLKNAKYATDMDPIDPQCDCPVCRRYSRAYIRHLFVADEMLAMRLAVMHNLYFYNKLMEKIRLALDNGTFAQFRNEYSEKLSRRI